MIRVLHIGDLHLGGNYPGKAAASIDFLLEQIELETSPAYQPDLVVCTGDTTEKPLHVHSEHLQPLLKLIHGVECPIIFLQGTPSHEPYGFLNNLESATRHIITVFDTPQVIAGPISEFACRGPESEKRIAIAALPAINKPMLTKWAIDLGLPAREPDDIIRSIMLWIAEQWKDFTGPKILLGHWTVNGCTTASGQTLYASDMAIGLEDLALSKADAVLLGHIHKAQKWDSPVLTAYCGSAYACNWGELDVKSFNVLNFNDNGKVGIQSIPYPHKPMMKINIEFTGERWKDGSWAWTPELYALVEAVHSEVKVSYSVSKELAAQIDDSYVRVIFKQMGIDLAAIERTIRATSRERIADISSKETTRSQYEAVCLAKGDEARIGALAKADRIDEQVVRV